MEETVFENQECSDILNDGFICIKVDREERPDIDKLGREMNNPSTSTNFLADAKSLPLYLTKRLILRV